MDTFHTVAAVVAAAGGVATLYGGARAIVGAVRFVVRAGRQIGDLYDDWKGEPARAGVAGRPGVMERLQHHDDAITAQGRALAEIRAQLHPNGGGSVRDALDRIESRVGQAPVQVNVGAPAPVTEGANHGH